MNIALTTLLVIFASYNAYASNAPYIAISNDIAKKTQMEVVANNIANSNTLGYEQDDIIYKKVDKKESKKKTNSFVRPYGNYRKNAAGGLKVTNNPLDVAIIGPGYFKVLTPRGPRYTLAGNFMINSQNVLVNADGYPVSSQGGQPIVLPDPGDYMLLDIAADGTIYADNDQVEAVGVFGFGQNISLMREGSGLFISTGPDIILGNDVATIQNRALRTSNVNSTRALTTMIELERSSETSRQLVTDLANLERNAVSRIMK